MTTSISEADTTSLTTKETAALDQPRVAPRGLLAHTIASRFLFLQICVSLVLSALAYGTVYYWSLALFGLSGVLILFFCFADGWRLYTLRFSKNVLQLSLLRMLALRFFRLLPFRCTADRRVLSVAADN